jgi:hypothetical protein
MHNNCHIDRDLVQFPTDVTPDEKIERVKVYMDEESVDVLSD